MELRRYFDLLRSRWLFITICAFVGMVGGGLVGRGDPTYAATSTLYIGSRTINDAPGQLSNDRTTALASVAQTFSHMIDTAPIASRALALTGAPLAPNALVARTSTRVEPGTQLLYVTVSDRDPAQARDLANGLADGFVQAVQDFEPAASQTEGAVPTLPAYVFERATLPTVPVPSGGLQSAVLGLMLGLVAGVGFVLLRDALDVTVRDVDDAESKLELPVLGAIPMLGPRMPSADGGRGQPR